MGKADIKYSYTKITNNQDGQKLVDNIHNIMQNDLNVIVYNFVDMLSHARTEMEVLKELAGVVSRAPGLNILLCIRRFDVFQTSRLLWC